MDLREIDLGVWIGFDWLRTGTGGGLLWLLQNALYSLKNNHFFKKLPAFKEPESLKVRTDSRHLTLSRASLIHSTHSSAISLRSILILYPTYEEPG
jgi:hypothetical protein